MKLSLPGETEDLLHRAAHALGRPVDDLAAEAINAMFGEYRRSKRWPLPKAVGIVDGESPQQRYGPRSDGQPWPASIGLLSDGGVPATAFDDWLEEHWIHDLEREMLVTSYGDDDRGVGEDGAAASGDGGVDGEANRRPRP